MNSRVLIEKRFRLARSVLFALWAVLSTTIVFLAVRTASDRAMLEVRQKAGETLAVQAETLTGVLDKYRLMAPLLARQSSVASLFIRDAGDNPQRVAATRMAEGLTGMSAAQDVAFLFPDGELLAHAHGAFVESGEGLADLVRTAAEGRLGRAMLSLPSGERSYAFSAGVRRNGMLVGVVIVYVDFYRVEAAWALSTRPIFVTDRWGTVVLANEARWRMKPVTDIGVEQGEQMILSDGGKRRSHIDLKRNLPVLGWDLHVLADPAPIEAARLSAGTIATLVCLLGGLIALILLRRSETAIIRARSDRATALRLERVVRDRTRALSVTNASLSREVEVRRSAEDRLRKAQAELVQSAKLAALGQMSAALSHEFNQPLAAIRTYADNGSRFLDLGKISAAAGNLDRIKALVDRMAELSRTLLSFARKPNAATGPVNLGTVVGEALLLARPRARAAHVAILADEDLGRHVVIGGRVRLGQVFVNLVNNAVDALSGLENGLVEIVAGRDGDIVRVEVRDNGPGIAAGSLEQVFDPFFTTKAVGEGIGIGLSIVDNIVRDFGGRIYATNRPEGGAAFVIELQAAKIDDKTGDDKTGDDKTGDDRTGDDRTGEAEPAQPVA